MNYDNDKVDQLNSVCDIKIEIKPEPLDDVDDNFDDNNTSELDPLLLQNNYPENKDSTKNNWTEPTEFVGIKEEPGIAVKNEPSSDQIFQDDTTKSIYSNQISFDDSGFDWINPKSVLELTNETAWKCFCDYNFKCDGFTEEDIIGFFDMFSLKNITQNGVTNFLAKLKAMYLVRCRRIFDEEFPNALKLINKKIPSYPKDDSLSLIEMAGNSKGNSNCEKDPAKITWLKFCDFTKKNYDFKNDDVINYFKMICEETGNDSRKIFDEIRKIAEIYSRTFNRKFHNDFDVANDYISTQMSKRKSCKRVISEVDNSPNTNNCCMKINTTNNISKIEHQVFNKRMDNEKVWSMFCSFADKENDFTEDDVIGFFEMMLNKNIQSDVCQTIMNKLALMYTQKSNKLLVDDFPLAKQFVSKRIRITPNYPDAQKIDEIRKLSGTALSKPHIVLNTIPVVNIPNNTVPSVAISKIQLPKSTSSTIVQSNPTETMVKIVHGEKTKFITEVKPQGWSIKTQKSSYFFKKSKNNLISGAEKNKLSTSLTHPVTVNLANPLSKPTLKYFSQKRQLAEIEVWNKFCHFTKKTSNFTEEDVIGFFESLFQNQETSIYAWKSRLETMYLSKTTRVLTKDFPNVDNFITSRMNTNKETLSHQQKQSNLKPKLNQFVQTYETVWKTFCDLSQKSEGFVEEDVLGFFETLLQKKTKPSTCSIYRAQLAVMYHMKTKRNFLQDCPNVNVFIINKLKDYEWDQFSSEQLWEFCDSILEQNNNFQETEIQSFFQKLCENDAVNQTLNCYRLMLASMYFLLKGKDFFQDFPSVDAMISRKQKL